MTDTHYIIQCNAEISLKSNSLPLPYENEEGIREAINEILGSTSQIQNLEIKTIIEAKIDNEDNRLLGWKLSNPVNLSGQQIEKRKIKVVLNPDRISHPAALTIQENSDSKYRIAGFFANDKTAMTVGQLWLENRIEL